jgi:nitroimidazol reductase NimA-like FMN-containing flavoprotein (pyridoxamine 5'-phosphate oxidase superfamily)
VDPAVSELTFEELRDDSLRYGPIAYLGTVSPSGTPYLSPVAVAWRGGELLAFVATAEAKVANLRANPKLTVHFAVGADTNWDSCILWGDARIVDTTEGRTELWGAMGYDLDRFEPGGPAADTHVFIVLQPSRGRVLRTYGTLGSFGWTRSP